MWRTWFSTFPQSTLNSNPSIYFHKCLWAAVKIPLETKPRKLYLTCSVEKVHLEVKGTVFVSIWVSIQWWRLSVSILCNSSSLGGAIGWPSASVSGPKVLYFRKKCKLNNTLIEISVQKFQLQCHFDLLQFFWINYAFSIFNLDFIQYRLSVYFVFFSCKFLFQILFFSFKYENWTWKSIFFHVQLFFHIQNFFSPTIRPFFQFLTFGPDVVLGAGSWTGLMSHRLDISPITLPSRKYDLKQLLLNTLFTTYLCDWQWKNWFQQQSCFRWYWALIAV